MAMKIEQLQEGLADHEARLSFLENSLPGSAMDYQEEEQPKPTSEPAWTQRQWEYVQQIKGQVIFLQNKLNEHLDKSPKKGRYD